MAAICLAGSAPAPPPPVCVKKITTPVTIAAITRRAIPTLGWKQSQQNANANKNIGKHIIKAAMKMIIPTVLFRNPPINGM